MPAPRGSSKPARNCRDSTCSNIDADSESRAVTSSDVNDFLREITGMDITAKDFRTWAGTVLAAMALSEFESFDSQVRAKTNVKRAIEQVAARLGNTPTICRKFYVHPEVLNSYLDGQLLENIKSEIETELRDEIAGLKPEEAAVLGLMRKRLGLESKSGRERMSHKGDDRDSGIVTAIRACVPRWRFAS
jgi:DNA topoisomerase-1